MSGSNRPRIAPGYTVGHLTVIRATGERKNGYTIWECACSCGGTRLLDTRCLQRGTVTDCGCVTKTHPGQRNLTGQRFGRLVCIEPTGHRDSSGNTLWKCRCDCGQECLAVGRQLTAGYKKSCGCLGHPPLEDLTGMTFGQMTVTGYAGKRGGMHRWSCLCSCGETTEVGQTLLRSGKTKSCGCLRSSVVAENMRLCDGTSVTTLEAGKHHRLRSNTSGCTGVYQKKGSARWCAQITFKKKTYYLGTYENFEDAVRARKRGEEMHDDFLEWYYKTHPEKKPKQNV